MTPVQAQAPLPESRLAESRLSHRLPLYRGGNGGTSTDGEIFVLRYEVVVRAEELATGGG